MSILANHDKTAYILPLGGFCNNRCSNCICRDQRSAAPRTRESIIQEAESMRQRFDGFILSDGEPTLLKDLPQIIADLKKLKPRILQIHTNGRMFAYGDYLHELLRVEGVDYLININAGTSGIHDGITQVKGSWAQTVMGIAGLARSERKNIGFHVSIPITSATIHHLDATVGAIAAMNPDSIILTGGYPACGESASWDFPVIEKTIQSVSEKHSAVPLRSQFLSGDRVVSSFNHRVVTSPSGQFFVGADTNNLWALRPARKSAKRSLILFMPYHQFIDKHMVLAAPSSLGILKGFAGALGYPCDLIDLEARNQRLGIDIGRHFPQREYFESGDFYAHLSNTPVMKECVADFEKLLPPESLEGYDVIALSMIDALSLSSGAAGVRYLRSAREDAVIAAGVMQEPDVPKFKDFADYCFEVTNFGAYGFCGMLNMIEYGDRAAAALRNRLSDSPDSRKIEVNVHDPHNPVYDLASNDISLYFKDVSADLLSFADSRQIRIDKTPTGFCMFYFSRGCKWKCTACNMSKLYAPEDPAASARRIIDIHDATGLNAFFILDPAINNHEPGLTVFCETLIRSGKNILWSSSARPLFKHPDILETMREAGCVSLVFGVESGSKRIMSLLNKGFGPGMSSKILRAAAAAGIWTQINLMSGFPTETDADVADTIHFLEEHADCIDSISDHSSFLWRDDVRVAPEKFGMRFIPGNIHHICGNSRMYEEIDGKSCREIHAGKLRAFTSIEAVRARWHVVTALITPYDIFQLYRSGYDRNTIHLFLKFLINKYAGQLDTIVEKAQSIRWRNERMQVLMMDFDAKLPVVIPGDI